MELLTSQTTCHYASEAAEGLKNRACALLCTHRVNYTPQPNGGHTGPFSAHLHFPLTHQKDRHRASDLNLRSIYNDASLS